MSSVEEFAKAAGNTGESNTEGPASLAFDPSRYRAELDQFDITDEQKQELLTTLWSIMCSFVELGFRADVRAMVLHTQGAVPDEPELG